MVRCPGQDTRYWTPEDIFDIKCPFCNKEIEFFKDEPFRICPECEAEVRNPKIDLGCAKWCKYAKECLGKLAPQDDEELSMCQRLIAEMRDLFGDDRKRISHALKILGFAEEILKHETADPLTVRAAAILHDTERKHNSSAEKIMKKLKIHNEVIEHVCKIIGSQHSANDIDTIEFCIIWDANWIVNISDEYPDFKESKILDLIEHTFKTEYGKKMALRKYTN